MPRDGRPAHLAEGSPSEAKRDWRPARLAERGSRRRELETVVTRPSIPHPCCSLMALLLSLPPHLPVFSLTQTRTMVPPHLPVFSLTQTRSMVPPPLHPEPSVSSLPRQSAHHRERRGYHLIRDRERQPARSPGRWRLTTRSPEIDRERLPVHHAEGDWIPAQHAERRAISSRCRGTDRVRLTVISPC